MKLALHPVSLHWSATVQVPQSAAQAVQTPLLAKNPELQVVHAVAEVQAVQLFPQALQVVSTKYPEAQVPQAVPLVQAVQLLPQVTGRELSK